MGSGPRGQHQLIIVVSSVQDLSIYITLLGVWVAVHVRRKHDNSSMSI